MNRPFSMALQIEVKAMSTSPCSGQRGDTSTPKSTSTQNNTHRYRSPRCRLQSGLTNSCFWLVLLLLAGRAVSQSTKPSSATRSIPARSLHLAENGDTLLEDIHHVDISPDGTHILTSDMNYGRVILWNALTGTPERMFVPDSSLSDSMAILATPTRLGKRFRRLQEYAHTSSSYRTSALGIMRNTYGCAVFTGNSTIAIAAQVRCGSVWSDVSNPETPVTVEVRTIIVTYDIGTMARHCTVLVPSPDGTFPQINFLAWSQRSDSYFVSACNYEAADSNNPEHMWALLSYKADGRIDRYVTQLPPECRNPKIGYNLFAVWADEFLDGHLAVAFGLLPRIYFPIENISFGLGPLGMINFGFFASTDTIPAEALHNPDTWNALLRIKPFRMRGIRATDTSSLVVLFQLRTPRLNSSGLGPPSWCAQEYSAFGELVRGKEFRDANTDEQIRYATYCRSQHAIYLFSLNKQTGWQIRIEPW
jgi:hypothetical protein